MTSEEQWREQEEVFLLQLEGALGVEESWRRHQQIIARYNNIEQEGAEEREEEIVTIEEISENMEIEEKIKASPNIVLRETDIEYSQECEFCDYRARILHTLQVHVQMHHMQVSYQCKMCNFTLTRVKEKYVTRKHITVVHGVKEEDVDKHLYVQCGLCENLETMENSFVHFETEHPQYSKYLSFSKNQSKKSSSDFTPSRCKYCSEDFSNIPNRRQLFKQHLQNVHLKATFKCDKCDFETKVKQGLIYHIQDTHMPANLERHEQVEWTRLHIIYQCNFCDFQLTFDKKGEMVKHMECSHGEVLKSAKTFSCNECDFLGGSNLKIRHHKNRAHAPIDTTKAFKCSMCKFGTNEPSNMTLHIHRHMQPKLICNICDFKTDRRLKLKSHFRDQHKREATANYMRNFVTFLCEVCQLKASSRAYDDHLVSHHNFTCLKEGQNKELKNSQEVVELKPFAQCSFVCTECDYGTNIASNMRIHIHRHIGSSFSCNLCGLKSRKKSIMASHFAAAHKEALKQKNWMENTITCHCKACGVTCSSKEFDQHLEKQHAYPAVARQYQDNTKTPMLALKLETEKVKTPITELHLKCPDCLYRSKYLYNIREHMHKVHTRTFYSCSLCKFNCIRRSQVERHISSVHKIVKTEVVVNSFTCHCKACGIAAKCDVFTNHLTTVHNFPSARKYESKCKETITSNQNQNTKPNHPKPIQIQNKYQTKTNRCNSCPRAFLSQNILHHHVARKHLRILYSCNICDLKTDSTSRLKEHVDTKHSGVSSSSTYCGTCDVTIQDNADQNHLKNVHSSLLETRKQNSNDFSSNFLILDKCKFCQSDSTIHNIEGHIRRNHIKMKYKCKKCSFASDNLYIKTHLKVAHKGEPNLLQMVCGLCSVELTKETLIEHIESHGNDLLETVYAYNKCSQCSFQTISDTKFKRHQISEHGIQFYKCSVCDLNFKSNQALINHVKINHPDFQYKCEHQDCPFDFKSKHFAALKRHLSEMHNGGSLYGCHLCSNTFRRNEYLVKHIEEDHNSDRTKTVRSAGLKSVDKKRFSTKEEKKQNEKKWIKMHRQRRRMMRRSK